jgi:ABC-type transport system involved in multi-copper enzyme maturation permease subunit
VNNIWAVAMVVIKELYRRKDFYVLFILTVLLTLLAGSVNFFNDDRIVRYVKEICLLLIWVAMLVVAITMGARHLPMEKENRTIFPLLAKPITRTEVVLGKFLGCWLACWVALAVFYAFFGVVCILREPEWLVLNYVQALLLHGFMLAIVLAMTMLGSIVFAAPSSNTTIQLVICTGILMMGRHLNKVAIQQPEPQQTLISFLYYVIPHLELFDVRDLIIHNWPRIPWPVCLGALLYAAAYSGFFLALACWRYHRRTLA